MNGNPFIPVASGDRFKPRRDWINRVSAMANAPRQGQGRSLAANLNEGLIFVKNSSGADVKDGEVLGIQDILFGPADNQNEFQFNFALKGRAVISSDLGRFVVARGPIASNVVGACYIGAVCPVRLKYATTTDKWAEAVSGQKYLQGGASGSAQVLYLAGGDISGSAGIRWALVRLSSTATCSTDSPKSLSTGATTWDRVADATGATFPIVTAVNWNTSTGVLSYQVRTVTADACGKLVTIGAESTSTVDTAVSCT